MAKILTGTRRQSLGQISGQSALIDAISKGKIHLAKFILDAVEGDVVDTRDFQGKTPLMRSVFIKETKCRIKAVHLLLQRKANVNLQDDHGRTALSYAVEHQCNEIVRILVQNNVDPDLADKKGNTALIWAAMVGNDQAIEILIKSFRRLGLAVDSENGDSLTALLIAAQHGHVECASLLAQDGKASVSKRDPARGMNAEEWAREQGCATPEVLPFSSVPSRNKARFNKYFNANDLSYRLSLAKMYGASIDDTDLDLPNVPIGSADAAAPAPAGMCRDVASSETKARDDAGPGAGVVTVGKQTYAGQGDNVVSSDKKTRGGKDKGSNVVTTDKKPRVGKNQADNMVTTDKKTTGSGKSQGDIVVSSDKTTRGGNGRPDNAPATGTRAQDVSTRGQDVVGTRKQSVTKSTRPGVVIKHGEKTAAAPSSTSESARTVEPY